MLRHLRRVTVGFVGGIVVTLGVAMVVLPGPAIVVIPAGLAILATEFQWARRLLHFLHTKLPKRRARTAVPAPETHRPSPTLKAS